MAERSGGSRRTLDPEVDVLTAEADAVQHLAAVDARVVAVQGPVEGEGVVGDLHAAGHRSVQPAPPQKKQALC